MLVRPSSRNGSRRGVSRGHERKEKRVVKYCKVCGESGHAAFECPEEEEADTIQCWNCGKYWHTQGECKGRRRRRAQRGNGEGECSSTVAPDKVVPPPPVPKRHDDSSMPVPPWFRKKTPPRPDSMNTSTSVDWLIDSGCNGHHITPSRDVFRSLRQAKRIKVKTAEKGGELTVEGVGDIDGFI